MACSSCGGGVKTTPVVKVSTVKIKPATIKDIVIQK